MEYGIKRNMAETSQAETPRRHGLPNTNISVILEEGVVLRTSVGGRGQAISGCGRARWTREGTVAGHSITWRSPGVVVKRISRERENAFGVMA